ncbi:MAG: toxin HicA [Polyangiales bacterium]
MRNNPSGVRFADACKVVTHFFGAPRQNGTSHKVWKMPWPGDPRINMQAGDGGKAKPYQVRQAIMAIDVLLARPTPEPSPATPKRDDNRSRAKKRRR